MAKMSAETFTTLRRTHERVCQMKIVDAFAELLPLDDAPAHLDDGGRFVWSLAERISAVAGDEAKTRELAKAIRRCAPIVDELMTAIDRHRAQAPTNDDAELAADLERLKHLGRVRCGEANLEHEAVCIRCQGHALPHLCRTLDGSWCEWVTVREGGLS